MSKKKGKIAILTGGGDCPGINAVIRAVAKRAILEYGLEVIGIEDGYDGVIHNRHRRLQYDDVSGIITLGGTILGTSNTANPYRYAVRKSASLTSRCVVPVLAASRSVGYYQPGEAITMGAPSLIPPPGFSELSKSEQVRYLQALWDQIAESPGEIPVPESHLELAEARLKRFREEPSSARPAFEILDRLSKRQK